MKMIPAEANLVIAKFMNNYDCCNCKYTGTAGGPKFYHQYPVCKIEGKEYEDFENCKSFEADGDSYDYTLSIDEQLPVLLKLANHYDTSKIVNKLDYNIKHPDDQKISVKSAIAIAIAIQGLY